MSHLKKRQSRQICHVITDLDFADDLALCSNIVEQAQELLSRVETIAMSDGLIINGKKTEVMPINFTDPVVIHTQEILN